MLDRPNFVLFQGGTKKKITPEAMEDILYILNVTWVSLARHCTSLWEHYLAGLWNAKEEKYGNHYKKNWKTPFLGIGAKLVTNSGHHCFYVHHLLWNSRRRGKGRWVCGTWPFQPAQERTYLQRFVSALGVLPEGWKARLLCLWQEDWLSHRDTAANLPISNWA